MNKHSRILVFIGLIAVLIALAACAPAPTPAPTAAPPTAAPKATTAPQPTAPPVAAKPVRIGASMSLTGRYDRIGKDLDNGYKLWVEQMNAKDGLLGRKIELVIYDDKSDPETAAKLYEKLITEDKVDLIIGPYSSPVTLPASTVTEKYKYPMIIGGASATEIWTRGFKYVFGIYGMAPTYLDGAIDIAKKQGYKTMAVINENSAFAKDTVKGAIEKGKAAGLSVVFEEEYSRDVRDLTPTLTKIKALNPDVLIGGTYGADATMIMRQTKDLNWAPRMYALTVGPALPDFFDTLKGDAEYVFGATQWEPAVKAPGSPEFVAAFKAKFGYEPGYHGAGAYAAGQLMEQAVKKAGAIDNEKIRDALATMTASTIYGQYKVDATGAQSGKLLFLVQWQKGKRVLVWPDEAAEAKFIVPTPGWDKR